MDGFVDLGKVARYFELCEKTENVDDPSLSDEEYDALASERVALFYECGLDGCPDEVFSELSQNYPDTV